MGSTVLTVNNTIVGRGDYNTRRVSRSAINKKLIEMGDYDYLMDNLGEINYEAVKYYRPLRPRTVEMLLINPYHSHVSFITVTVINEYGIKDASLDDKYFVGVMSKLEMNIHGSYMMFCESMKRMKHSRVMAHSFRLQNFEAGSIDKQVLEPMTKVYTEGVFHRILMFPTLETPYIFTQANLVPWPIYRGLPMPIDVAPLNFNPECENVDWVLNT